MAISLVSSRTWASLHTDLQAALVDFDFHRPELLKAAFKGHPEEFGQFVAQLCPQVEAAVEGPKLQELWEECDMSADAAIRRGVASVNMVNLARFEKKRSSDMMLQRVQAAHETLAPHNFAQDTAKAAKLDKPMVFFQGQRALRINPMRVQRRKLHREPNGPKEGTHHSTKMQIMGACKQVFRNRL